MKKTYFDLSTHSTRQLVIFFILMFGLAFLFFNAILPLASELIKDSLMGQVYNAGEEIPVTLNSRNLTKNTDYYTNWAVDTYIGTMQENRYWINPLYSFSLPVLLIAMTITLAITSLLPQSIGYMRQKIEREITLAITKIAIAKEGHYNESILREISDELKYAELKILHDYADMTGYTVQDLKVLKKAIKWLDYNIIKKTFLMSQSIQIYMRFYFTERYANTVLGLVYLGAAFLIIIIGLRGLKFIPSTQPSLVFFALGLEFTMLFTYAFTLMFSREEEDVSDNNNNDDKLQIQLSNNYGSDKQVEKLLRVFIKSNNSE